MRAQGPREGLGDRFWNRKQGPRNPWKKPPVRVQKNIPRIRLKATRLGHDVFQAVQYVAYCPCRHLDQIENIVLFQSGGYQHVPLAVYPDWTCGVPVLGHSYQVGVVCIT